MAAVQASSMPSAMVSADTVKSPPKRVTFVRRKKVPYYDPAEYADIAAAQQSPSPSLVSVSGSSSSSSTSPVSTPLSTPTTLHTRLPTRQAAANAPHYQKRSINGGKQDDNTDGLMVYLFSQQLTLSSAPSPLPPMTKMTQPAQGKVVSCAYDNSRPTTTSAATARSQAPSRPVVRTVRRKTVPKVTDYKEDDVDFTMTTDPFSSFSLWSMAADAYPDIANTTPHPSPKTLTTKMLRSTSSSPKHRSSLSFGALPASAAMSSNSSSSSISRNTNSGYSSSSGSSDNLSQRSSISSQGGVAAEADDVRIADVDFVTKMGFNSGFDDEAWGHAI